MLIGSYAINQQLFLKYSKFKLYIKRKLIKLKIQNFRLIGFVPHYIFGKEEKE